MYRPSRKQFTAATTSSSWRTMKATGKQLDKAAGNFSRWVVSDHYGFGQSLIDMPAMGFWSSCQYVLVRFLVALVAIFLSGLLTFLLIMSIPFLLIMMIT